MDLSRKGLRMEAEEAGKTEQKKRAVRVSLDLFYLEELMGLPSDIEVHAASGSDLYRDRIELILAGEGLPKKFEVSEDQKIKRGAVIYRQESVNKFLEVDSLGDF